MYEKCQKSFQETFKLFISKKEKKMDTKWTPVNKNKKMK